MVAPVRAVVPGVAELGGGFHGSGRPCVLGDTAFVSSPQLLLHQPAFRGKERGV